MTNPGRVSLKKIVKRHGAFTALHDIDLDIACGSASTISRRAAGLPGKGM
jgi:hypothetical protein